MTTEPLTAENELSAFDLKELLKYLEAYRHADSDDVHVVVARQAVVNAANALKLQAARLIELQSSLDLTQATLGVATETIAEMRARLDQPPRDGISPSHDACVDIFNDYDKAEVERQPKSIQFAWEVGRQLAALRPTPAPAAQTAAERFIDWLLTEDGMNATRQARESVADTLEKLSRGAKIDWQKLYEPYCASQTKETSHG